MNKNLLITGGAGYIGRQLAYALIEQGFKVFVLDNLCNGDKKFLPKKVKFIQADLTNIDEIRSVFRKNKIDCVFHLAALISVPESQKYPNKYIYNNVIGTENLLSVMREYRCKKIIFSSTCAVYGKSKKIFFNEKNIKDPQSIYGLSKLYNEECIQRYYEQFGIKYAILRYFNVVGADRFLRTGPTKSGSLFQNLSKVIIKKGSLSIFGNNYKTYDGTAIRDYIDVNDLVNIHIAAFKKINTYKNLILNCGYNKGYSVKDIIIAFETINNVKIRTYIKKARPGDVPAIISDTKKIKKFFPNFKQKFNLEKSVNNQIKWNLKFNAKRT